MLSEMALHVGSSGTCSAARLSSCQLPSGAFKIPMAFVRAPPARLLPSASESNCSQKYFTDSPNPRYAQMCWGSLFQFKSSQM